MKTLSLKLPDSLDSRLTVAARQQGAAKSEIVRGALEAYLEGGRARGRPSVLDLAGPLVGALEGPRDLASNPDHLRGYGE